MSTLREVLNARPVAAHVERVEIVNIKVLAAIVSFTCPELGVRLALQDIAGLNEGLELNAYQLWIHSFQDAGNAFEQ